MIRLIYYVIFFGECFLHLHGKSVIDFDGSILEQINQNPTMGYLIKFYAPWFVFEKNLFVLIVSSSFRCGHCRTFEPVYEEIAQAIEELSFTDDELKNIRVGRLDATVHSNVANYFDIRGYPSVKFIRGTQIISYENQRSKSAVLNFLKRVNGPAIRWIDSIDQYEQIRGEREVFFLLLSIDSSDVYERLIKEYSDVVNRYLSQAYFYATNSSIIHQKYLSEYSSGVLAIKTDGIFPWKSNNDSLDDFILQEKVATFPQVAAGNMYDLILTKKILVIYGFNGKQQTRFVSHSPIKSHSRFSFLLASN